MVLTKSLWLNLLLLYYLWQLEKFLFNLCEKKLNFKPYILKRKYHEDTQLISILSIKLISQH